MENIKTGKFISELRKEKKLTQKTLAEMLGVTDKAVSKWERGLGYPDVSILKNLSEVLGVNVNELLAGEKDAVDTKSNAAKINNIVLDVIQYSEFVQAEGKMKRYGFLFGIASIIGIMICIICNIAINQEITWAFYPIGGVVVVWAGLLPFFIAKKRRFLYSILGLYITTVPYLLLIEYLSSSKGWFISIALPISTLSAVYLIVVLMLFIKLHISKWFISSIAVSLLIVYNFIIDKIIQQYELIDLFLKLSIETLIALTLLIIGFNRNQLSRK